MSIKGLRGRGLRRPQGAAFTPSRASVSVSKHFLVTSNLTDVFFLDGKKKLQADINRETESKNNTYNELEKVLLKKRQFVACLALTGIFTYHQQKIW